MRLVGVSVQHVNFRHASCITWVHAQLQSCAWWFNTRPACGSALVVGDSETCIVEQAWLHDIAGRQGVCVKSYRPEMFGKQGEMQLKEFAAEVQKIRALDHGYVCVFHAPVCAHICS